jgi:hypothetical protein
VTIYHRVCEHPAAVRESGQVILLIDRPPWRIYFSPAMWGRLVNEAEEARAKDLSNGIVFTIPDAPDPLARERQLVARATNVAPLPQRWHLCPQQGTAARTTTGNCPAN